MSRRTDGAAASSSVARSGESGCSVSSQIASAWPTTTGTLTHVAWIGRSGSSMILRVSARSFDSSSNSSPSKSQSMRRSCSSGLSPRRRSIACAPAPETDWYVATRTRASPASSYSGLSTHVSGIVQQFGLATMPPPSGPLPARGRRSPRHDERDARLEPVGRRLVDRERAAAHGVGDELAEAPVPTEKRKMSTSPRESASGVASSTV